MNNNLIFLHLAKNGGTTFHSILNRMYLPQETFTIKTVTQPKTNLDVFLSLDQKEKNKIRLVKGHAPFGLHKHLQGTTDYLTFLRKPEERLVSFYYYVLRKPNNKLFNTITKNNMSLYDFVTQVKSADVNNSQVRSISGIDDKEEFMLEKALENIENHFSFVGLTEKYDESLIMLKTLYNWSMPYYEIRNKTKKRPTLNQINKKTIEAINHFNQADTILYNTIETKLNQEFKTFKNLRQNVLKLKLYNKIYSNQISRNIAGKIKRIIY
ncbi:sulfotransferase family protein [Lutibacter oceani]|uniref:Sulfotransferase family protein n=1 Tax=Lutibacter oceani TaxID=1853311 RepID=A0A3D9RW53_9FLAO|nr:sulfotransferase family 2 domain-containing protein [Lutibacter oceani]REE81991.1 sulfotransferase family protein [Lutibacter oceani]